MTDETHIYTFREVVVLLRNYLALRSYFDGCAVRVTTEGQPAPVQRRYKRMPFGMTPDGAPWPFMEAKRASKSFDGKTRAVRETDLMAAMFDLEAALGRLSDEDRAICFAYYIEGYTLEECLPMFGLASEGSLSVRTRNIVKKLLKELNG